MCVLGCNKAAVCGVTSSCVCTASAISPHIKCVCVCVGCWKAGRGDAKNTLFKFGCLRMRSHGWRDKSSCVCTASPAAAPGVTMVCACCVRKDTGSCWSGANRSSCGQHTQQQQQHGITSAITNNHTSSRCPTQARHSHSINHHQHKHAPQPTHPTNTKHTLPTNTLQRSTERWCAPT